MKIKPPKNTNGVKTNYKKIIEKKLEEKEDIIYNEPQPATNYIDNYVEYHSENDNTDNNSEISCNSSTKEECGDSDEEYNGKYSFIYKLNQNSIEKIKVNQILTLDEYEDECEDE